MPQAKVDVKLDFEADTTQARNGARSLERSLEAVEKQANETRDRMEKIGQVGQKLALVGGALTGPLLLAMKKFVDASKETDPAAQKIVESVKRMDEAVIRIGKVVANEVGPYIDQIANLAEGLAKFVEENPGFVQAALGIGGTLVALGGIVTTTAQIVSTMATLQGVLAGSGIVTGAGAGAAGAAAGAGGLGAILTGVLSSPAVIGAFAVAIGSMIGKAIGEGILGREVKWAEVFETIKLIFQITLRVFTDMFRSFGLLLRNVADWVVTSLGRIFSAIGSWFQGGKASGGYAGPGLYALGERGREFVLTAATTRAAENVMGGRLTQAGVMSAMTNNINLTNGMTVTQARRMMAENRAGIMASLLG